MTLLTSRFPQPDYTRNRWQVVFTGGIGEIVGFTIDSAEITVPERNTGAALSKADYIGVAEALSIQRRVLHSQKRSHSNNDFSALYLEP